MESEPTEERDVTKETADGTPVCIRCFKPIDPLSHYCPNCGEATGQLTQYLPFVNIPWQASVWGRMWRQVWSCEISFPGRIFRLFMIIWNVPIMLIGLFFRFHREPEKELNQNNKTNNGQILHPE
jgi:hypothetical protein